MGRILLPSAGWTEQAADECARDCKMRRLLAESEARVRKFFEERAQEER